ncbi:MAG: M14 family metallopeptidase [Polyangiaceae bacterium]
MIDLGALYLGFRERFLTYDELTRQVHAWADAAPELVHLESLAKSEEGRDVWLLTIGREPNRVRPAAWIDGNIHASELSGSSVCLAVAEALIAAHAGGRAADLPEHVRSWLARDVLFYVLPRMCPDGAERVLRRRHFVRSNPRDHRRGDRGAYWRHDDVDGDGASLLMRKVDPTGDFVASSEFPGVMLPRRVEDAGPYYKLYPEGFIEGFDGFEIPAPYYLSDTEVDLNRNYPSDWRAEPEQAGAGPYPGSEPESRAVIEFTAKRPNIFLWECMHTFGGVYIRPLNDKPDTKMDALDAAVFRQLEAWADELVGYPTVSGFQEFTYEPEKPLHGELANYAYVERGAIGFVCEIWDFFKQVGFEVKRPFIKNYEERTGRADILKIAAWDRDHNRGRIVGAWRHFHHPQLGDVEVGGYDPLIGIWNPPLERLAEVCDAQTRLFLRLAALAPRVTVDKPKVEPLEGDLYRVELVVSNEGYLPTYFLGSAKVREFADPLRARLELDPAMSLLAGNNVELVGHLSGWGGNDRSTSPSLARSTNEHTRHRLTWIIRGSGELTITIGNARCGEVRTPLSLRKNPQ